MKNFPIPLNTPASFKANFSAGHPATDIFAALGSPVLAVADGKISHETEPKGGNALYLFERNGNQYFYGHLDSFVSPMKTGEFRDVKAGELVGYVGATGSSAGREPHIHFEFRPMGGGKVDPFPALEAARKNQPYTDPLPIPREPGPITTLIPSFGASGSSIALFALSAAALGFFLLKKN